MKALIAGLVAALSLSPASGWQRDGSFVNERDYLVASHEWVSIDDGSSIAPFDETTDVKVGDLIAHYTRYDADGDEISTWDVTVDHVSLV